MLLQTLMKLSKLLRSQKIPRSQQPSCKKLGKRAQFRILKKAGKDACRPELSSEYGLKGKNYKLSPDQAKSILELRLGRLTGLEQDNLSTEFNEILEIILELQKILDDKDTLLQLIKDELIEVRENLAMKEEQILMTPVMTFPMKT